MAEEVSSDALPEVVTVLRCPNGSVVYVVGTAHFSRQSAEDVRVTISSTKPQAVVLELCQERQMILLYSEEDILREAQSMSLSKVRSFIQRDGLVPGITQSLFLKMSAQLTKQLGVAPGGEFRAGFEEAQKINARVVLGDRAVGVTFKRAMASLSLWKRLHLGFSLLQTLGSGIDITPEDMEELKKKDMVTLLMGELSEKMPDLSEVFVTERDKILAYSLMRAANCVQVPYGPPVTVVGVMGMGHVSGVEEHWMQPIPLKELLSIPAPSRASRVVWTGVQVCVSLTALGLVVGGAYVVLRHISRR